MSVGNDPTIRVDDHTRPHTLLPADDESGVVSVVLNWAISRYDYLYYAGSHPSYEALDGPVELMQCIGIAASGGRLSRDHWDHH